MKERLQRLDVIFYRNPVYFITANTEGRKPMLANTCVHEAFCEFARKGAAFGASVGRYVVMPDHIHLFVALDDRRLELGAWMKSLKNTLSKTLRLQGHSAPHWQKGYFDHVLRSAESYDEKWRYVRENPVRAGLATNIADWPFQGTIHPIQFNPER